MSLAKIQKIKLTVQIHQRKQVLTSFTHCSGVSIVGLEQIPAGWILLILQSEFQGCILGQF